MTRFAAIDFETANYNRHSACAIGVSVVENGRIVDSIESLICPPETWFQFTYVHGLAWEDVCDAPTFEEVWKDLRKELRGTKFFAAHNAPFDRGVLAACCEYYDLAVPRTKFVCTVSLARQCWSVYPTKLPDVCEKLRINLKHHDAASDAEACARIVIAAQKSGWKP